MSEEKEQTLFMEGLDQWTEVYVIKPLYAASMEAEEFDDPERWDTAADSAKYAIREKVLESYSSGWQAGFKAALAVFEPLINRR